MIIILMVFLFGHWSPCRLPQAPRAVDTGAAEAPGRVRGGAEMFIWLVMFIRQLTIAFSHV